MVELTMPDLAAAMRAAVRGLVDRLDTEQRRQLVFPFAGDMHKRWTYLPGQRPGLRLGDLSEEQLEPALDLLQLIHSLRGWSDTQLVIRIEAVRRELSLHKAGRAGVDPYRDLPYWLVVLGDPTSTEPWAWRINGHHLLAQATVVGDQVNGVPHFFGAEPATVLEGQHAGLRALPREEDLARELMLALQEDQRRMAWIAVKAPADIASRWDPMAALPEQPRGIPYARLDRPLPPIHLDQDRRPDPQESQPSKQLQLRSTSDAENLSRRLPHCHRPPHSKSNPTQVSTAQAFLTPSGSGTFLLLSRRSHTNGRSSTSFSSGDTPPAPEPKYRTPLL